MALVLVLAAAACSVGAIDPGYLQAGAHRAAVGGVTAGGIEVIRHGANGLPDPGLNSTLALRLQPEGGLTGLVISVDDPRPVNAVTMDVHYDPQSCHPVQAVFHDLLGSEEQVLRASVLDHVPGMAGVGEVLIGLPYHPAVDGDFATVYFADGPSRTTSAQVSSVSQNPGVGVSVGGVPNFIPTPGTPDGEASVTWYAGWNAWDTGDGDQNGVVTLGDLVPIGLWFSQGWSAPKDPTPVWGSLRADYDTNGLVTLGDIQRIAAHFNEQALNYLVEAADDTGSATRQKVADVPAGPDPPPTGAGTSPDLGTIFKKWNVDFTDTSTFTFQQLTALDADANGKVNVYVTPQDASTPPLNGTEAFLTLDVVIPTPTITSIDISFPGSATWLKRGNDYVVLVTELSVDDVLGNAEQFTTAPFAPETLGLTAMVETQENPGNLIDGTQWVIWYIQSGAGLGSVADGGSAGPKGELSFNDRGLLTVAAHAPGNFAVVGTITFRLCSIESLALSLASGGSGPTSVSPGTAVQFKVTGTFDFDTDPTNGNEETQTLTPYCNWGALVNPAGTPIKFDSGVAKLNTTGAAHGAKYQVTCEFPTTDDVSIYDNVKRASNFVTVNIT
jgi:hypothetical protein